MNHHLNAVLKSLEEPMIQTVQAWVRHPSVKAPAQAGAPFGPDVRAMLDLALADCQRLGFATQNIDGYAGHADLGQGDDAGALAILAHVDIVPPGDGWQHDPYGAAIDGGRVYGRGTSDDKGPAVAALYAMHAVARAGIPLKRKVRLILGCDEESGWEDIAYYKQHAVMPRSGFSPDAAYPLINLEKGMLGLKLEAPSAKEGLQVIQFATGERTNVIPGIARATVKNQPDLAQRATSAAQRFGWPATVQEQGEHLLIETTGIPGHAAYPELARNAIGQMLVLLNALGVQGPLKTLAQRVGITSDASGLGAGVEDTLSGKLTCNLGIIRADEQGIYATLDIRYPLLANPQALEHTIRQHLPEFRVTVTTSKEPHYVNEQSELVQALLESYHQVTGLEKKALSTGGGTYAKVLEEGVAFGATFPDEPDVAHQADEHMSVSSLVKSMYIFADAIVRLAGK